MVLKVILQIKFVIQNKDSSDLCDSLIHFINLKSKFDDNLAFRMTQVRILVQARIFPLKLLM